MIVYDKVMTRDCPLVMVESWYYVFTQSIPKICGFAWPKPIYVFRSGAVSSFRPSKLFHEELPLKLSAWAKKASSKKPLLASFEVYKECAKLLKTMKVEKVSTPEAVKRIQQIYDAFLEGGAGLIIAYWMVEWNKKALDNKEPALFDKEIIETAMKLREGDTLMDDGIDLAYGYLYTIAQNENLPKESVKFLLLKEIKSIARKKPDLKTLQSRQNGYAYTDKQLVLAKDLSAYLNQKSYELNDPEVTPTNMLTGMGASKGKTKGKVVLIFNRDQINKVNKGDVLVAPMTTPWYIPAMEKAAAFITDEGGIMCHAAIVAREMKKPCIIGTKIATKVLKDGDLVEVDADKGTVRKCS